MLSDILLRLGGRKRITTEQYIKIAKRIYGYRYEYSKTIYVNPHTKIIIICPIHGEFLRTPTFHLEGFGCPHHKKRMYKSIVNISYDNIISPIEKFKKRAFQIYGRKYDYSKVEYVNQKINVIITCKKHGDFKQSPSYFLHNKGGCPDCKIENRVVSKGEAEIKRWLLDNNIRFKRQKKFLGLLNRKTKYKQRSPLRIDFFLPDYKLLIEYDGEQHFKCTNFKWNTKKKYQTICQNDRLKNNYCRRNNIRLYRIHYEDFKNIDWILYDLLINCKHPRLICSSNFVSESKSKTILEEAGVLINK
jgi:hypothetical protein